MPLPINSTLSLLGASRPGDALPSRPKKAMLVRMSSEILDTLEATAQPLVQFEFGENPGLYIGGTCFAMVHSQETAMHELYLRAPSATKKNAPLKLYANVVGKFTIEKREIGNELRDKIRESTQDAAAQKNSRATVFMEAPPETQPVNKKRKDAAMFHKPLRQSDKVKPVPSGPTSSTPAKVTPTHQSSTSHQGGVPVRKRLVHCLARGEKSEEEIFKLLGADRNASLRAEVAGLLDQLSDLKTDKSVKVYRLKPTGWKEVRPFEWPGLSEQERVQLARNGRLTLKSLRIPESDPLWTYFHYKTPAGNSTPSEPTRTSTYNAPTEDKPRPSATEPPKRGVSSRELKEKKMKPKANPKAEIQMKDESQRALKRPPADNVSEVRRIPVDAPRDIASAQIQPPARPTKPLTRREIEKEPSSSSTALPKPSTSHGEKSKPKEAKRLRESGVYGSDSEQGRVKVKERIQRKELQDDVSLDLKPKLAKKRMAEEDDDDKSSRKSLDGNYPNSRGSLKRKARDDDPEAVNPKAQKRRPVEEENYTARKPSKLKTRADDEYTSSKSRGTSKRKAEQVDDDDYEPVRQKKPRFDLDSISSTLSSSRDETQRKGHAATKKISMESRMDDRVVPKSENVAQSASTSKIRKVSTPPPTKSNPLPDGRETDLRRSSTLSGTSSAKPKVRRKSPIYTSTEDEKDDDFAKPSGKTTPAATTNTTTTTKEARNRSSQPLPSDNNLRTTYSTTYLEHLSVMWKLLVQKGRLETLLKNGDLNSSGTISDSEGDVELLPPEDLEILTANHKRLVNELQVMQDAYEQRTKGESLSD